jgi:hypothetical protein
MGCVNGSDCKAVDRDGPLTPDGLCSVCVARLPVDPSVLASAEIEIGQLLDELGL